MPMIDFTPRCRKCGREIKLEEVASPCPECGFDNLRVTCQEGMKWAEKRLAEIQKIQEENDKRMKDPNYEGPRFAGQL